MKAKSISYNDFKLEKFKTVNTAEDHPILVFLRKNKRAYNIGAICKATKLMPSAARSMLRKLRKQGKVIHKAPFFAYKR